MKLLLASQSPRRKELLSALGYDFNVVPVDCDETYPENLNTEDIAGFLSELKAKAFRLPQEDEVLLAADTIVALDGEVLGKPKNKEEAHQMLKKLSGRTHQVYTAISLRTKDSLTTKTDVAEVEFDSLSHQEINFYINTFKPFDKAGAYGIQEWIGMAKIKKIKGSFYTIMGLPTHVLHHLLERYRKTD